MAYQILSKIIIGINAFIIEQSIQAPGQKQKSPPLADIIYRLRANQWFMIRDTTWICEFFNFAHSAGYGTRQNAPSDTAFYDNGEAPLESTKDFIKRGHLLYQPCHKNPFSPKLRGYFSTACTKTCTNRLFSADPQKAANQMRCNTYYSSSKPYPNIVRIISPR